MEKYQDYLKGRGAQINTPNPYQKSEYDTQAEDGLDEPFVPDPQTQLFFETPKKIINKVDSPDIPLPYSINPYQGCEHGCVYCYARNVHQYWGFSAGLDFERKLIVKKNAPELLAKELSHAKWKPAPVMFSGNTDCYQPIERQLELTRECLKVFLRFRHPVGLITKNSLILRDLDLLEQLASHNLVHVMISVTTLDEELRRKMEPRTATGKRRIETIRQLAAHNIPVGVMAAPIIPGLNVYEIHEILKQSAEAGALSCGYTLVRLNNAVSDIFEDWIRSAYPDRADKVLDQIRQCRKGNLHDTQFGRRMRGEGALAESINAIFKQAKNTYFKDRKMPPYNIDAFQKPGQLSLGF